MPSCFTSNPSTSYKVSPVPYKTIFNCLGESLPTGTSMEKLCFLTASCKSRMCQPVLGAILAHGLTAPCAIVKFLFGNTNSSSTSNFVPNPVQAGQAPCGLLKEKFRGSISIIFIPHLGQANLSDNTKSSSVSDR